jgi:hypothetical protein
MLLEYSPSSFLYPLIVHGKPVGFFTVPAFVPIMFRINDSVFGVYRFLWGVRYESFAAFAPPDF